MKNVVRKPIVYDDDEDDLEALRMAALSTIGQKQKFTQHRRRPHEMGPYFRPKVNPNLIAIVPVDDVKDIVQVKPKVEETPKVTCEKKLDPPKELQKKSATELVKPIAETSAKKEDVSVTKKGEVSPAKKDDLQSHKKDNIQASHTSEKQQPKTKKDAAAESSGDELEDKLDFELDEESDDEMNFLSLGDDEDLSLEKLMDQMEQEFNSVNAKKERKKKKKRDSMKKDERPKKEEKKETKKEKEKEKENLETVVETVKKEKPVAEKKVEEKPEVESSPAKVVEKASSPLQKPSPPRSPVMRKTPPHRKSLSPRRRPLSPRRWSQSPPPRRCPSPYRNRSPLGWSPRRRSRSPLFSKTRPAYRRSRSPGYRRSRSPFFRRSRSPYRRSRSPIYRRRSLSPRDRSPFYRRSSPHGRLSPKYRVQSPRNRPYSPPRQRSPYSPHRARSPRLRSRSREKISAGDELTWLRLMRDDRKYRDNKDEPTWLRLFKTEQKDIGTYNSKKESSGYDKISSGDQKSFKSFFDRLSDYKDYRDRPSKSDRSKSDYYRDAREQALRERVMQQRSDRERMLDRERSARNRDRERDEPVKAGVKEKDEISQVSSTSVDEKVLEARRRKFESKEVILPVANKTVKLNREPPSNSTSESTKPSATILSSAEPLFPEKTTEHVINADEKPVKGKKSKTKKHSKKRLASPDYLVKKKKIAVKIDTTSIDASSAPPSDDLREELSRRRKKRQQAEEAAIEIIDIKSPSPPPVLAKAQRQISPAESPDESSTGSPPRPVTSRLLGASRLMQNALAGAVRSHSASFKKAKSKALVKNSSKSSKLKESKKKGDGKLRRVQIVKSDLQTNNSEEEDINQHFSK